MDPNEWFYEEPNDMLSAEQRHHVRVMEENAVLRRLAEGVHRVLLIRTDDGQPANKYRIVELTSLPDMLRRMILALWRSGRRDIWLNLSTPENVIDAMLDGRYQEVDRHATEMDQEESYMEMLEVADAVHGTNLAAQTEGWEEIFEEDELGNFPGYPSLVFDEFLEMLRPVRNFVARAMTEGDWQATPDVSTASATTILI